MLFSKLYRYKHKFTRERNLILRLNNRLRKLKELSNNRKKILLESRQIIFIIKQLEKTDVYWFIHGDVNKVKNYIIKVKKNPKNKGLVNILAGVYIVAPLTFELTGIIMFFRYVLRLINKYLLKSKFL